MAGRAPSAVRKAFRHRALVQRCQWHKRENVVSHLAKREHASWRQRLQRAYNRPTYDEAVTALTALHGELEHRNQSAARSLAEGPERDLDAPPPRAIQACWALAEDHERAGIRQCARRRTLCESRSLQNSESTAPLAGHCAPGHRTTVAEGDGLPSPSHASGRVEGRTEDRYHALREGSGVMSNQEPRRVSTKNGLTPHELASPTRPGRSWTAWVIRRSG